MTRERSAGELMTDQEGPTPKVLIMLLPGYFGLREDERLAKAEKLIPAEPR